MSRIGKQTIIIPEKVTVSVDVGQAAVRGPKGEMRRVWPRELTLTVSSGVAKVCPKDQDKESELSALWGTYVAHLKNMIKGVTAGFEKRLIIEGIGYKAVVNGETVTLNVGFSHPVVVSIPTGLKVAVDKNLITVSGIDREAVGQFTASLRAIRPPNPYKERGFHYADEVVIRKQGKKAVSTV